MEKKKTKKLHINMEDELLKRLRDHVNLVGYDQSKLIEKILQNFLDKNK